MEKKFPEIKITFLGVILLVPAFFDRSYESLITLISAFTHEMGHIIVMLLLNVKLKKIILTPLGFEIETSGEYQSFYKEFFVNSGGCAINFLSYFIFEKSGGYFTVFAETSLLLGIMNIMPVRCLDGGEALESLLNLIFLPDTAELICRCVSFVFIFIMWVIAIYIFMFSGGNYSLFLMAVWLFSKIFL